MQVFLQWKSREYLGNTYLLFWNPELSGNSGLSVRLLLLTKFFSINSALWQRYIRFLYVAGTTVPICHMAKVLNRTRKTSHYSEEFLHTIQIIKSGLFVKFELHNH